jgi:hypothetical protein
VRERFSVPEWVCWLRRHHYLPKKNNFLTQVSFLSLGWWGKATMYEAASAPRRGFLPQSPGFRIPTFLRGYNNSPGLLIPFKISSF